VFSHIVTVIAFGCIFLNLFLGLLALTHSRKNSIHRPFFMMNAVLVLWNVAYYVTVQTGFLQVADIVVLECTAVLIPAVVLHFIVRFTGIARRGLWILFGYAAALAWCCIFIFTSLEIWKTTAGLVGITTLVIGTICAIMLINALRRTPEGGEKKCLAVITFGFFMYFVLGLTDYLCCFLWDLYLFTSMIGSLIFSLCIAWAVFTYQLLDLRESIRQAIWAATLFVLAYFLYLGVHHLVMPIPGMEPLALVIGILVVAYILSPIGPSRIREAIHSIFFPDKMTLVDIINNFMAEEVDVNSVENLVTLYLGSITDGLSAHSGMLYLHDDTDKLLLAGFSGDGQPPLLPKSFSGNERNIFKDIKGFRETTLDIAGEVQKVIILRFARGKARPLLILKHTDSEIHFTALEQRFLEILSSTFVMGLARLKGEEGRQPAKRSQCTRFGPFVGGSVVMQELYSSIRKVASSGATVLIQGESGTGKELAATMIHQLSNRKNGPFVAVNCAILTGELLTSELFGHERGSFTGAVSRRIGKFEQASGGTLFLDEIGEIPSATQTMLLRVLEEKKVVRVGGNETVDVNVRIVAATNSNLTKEVETGSFREDLYYRLNVLPIDMPPLRERDGDIPLLVDFFIAEISKRFSKSVSGISQKALDSLLEYSWSGNVRELANIIERAVLVTESDTIKPGDLGLFDRFPSSVVSLKDTEKSAEREALLAALRHTDGNVTHAARLLGVSRVTLQKKMKKYQLRDIFNK
jgi:DNA-binding NtrC family response regulator